MEVLMVTKMICVVKMLAMEVLGRPVSPAVYL